MRRIRVRNRIGDISVVCEVASCECIEVSIGLGIREEVRVSIGLGMRRIRVRNRIGDVSVVCEVGSCECIEVSVGPVCE